jgi:hypothetical protein
VRDWRAFLERVEEAVPEPGASSDDALAKTLVVRDDEDGARVLLNPAVVDEEGDWEAWFFAHWVPGAEPYSSFRELLEETYSRFVDDEKARRGEPTPRVAPGLGVAAEDLQGLVDALRRPDANDRWALSTLWRIFGTPTRSPPSLQFSRISRKTHTSERQPHERSVNSGTKARSTL